jgi:hypothetical protein
MQRWQDLRNKIGLSSWRCRVQLAAWSRKARLKKFGLTEEDYQRILAEQGGVCAICSGPPDTRWKTLAVDHDHVTRKVRGLLCMVCNTMLGRFEARQKEIMEYLGL